MVPPWKTLAIVTLIGIGASALSETKPSAKKRDPNEMVCERVKLPGSRVDARKVCGTRAQWEELRKRERELANQAPPSPNNGCQTVAMYPMSPGC